ncbi:MAG TPA: hypothetical protein VF322_13020 [Gammaproteobacteria bacterium]
MNTNLEYPMRLVSRFLPLVSLLAAWLIPEVSTAAQWQLSVGSCPVVAPGGSADCGLVTLTAVGGSLSWPIGKFYSQADVENGSGAFTIHQTVPEPACNTMPSLAEGESCNAYAVTFSPPSPGVYYAKIDMEGGYVDIYGSTVADMGTVELSFLGQNPCATSFHKLADCGDIIITAVGGDLPFGSHSEYDYDNGNLWKIDDSLEGDVCGNGPFVLAEGESCLVAHVGFFGDVADDLSTTFEYSTGGPEVYALELDGIIDWEASNWQLSMNPCPVVPAGSSEDCGLVTLTATHGPLTWATGQFYNQSNAWVSNNSGRFSISQSVPEPACNTMPGLAEGETCNAYFVSFHPNSPGVFNAAIYVGADGYLGVSSRTLSPISDRGSSQSSGKIPALPALEESHCGEVVVTAVGGDVPFAIDWYPKIESDEDFFRVTDVRDEDPVPECHSDGPFVLPDGQSCGLLHIEFLGTEEGTFSLTSSLFIGFPEKWYSMVLTATASNTPLHGSSFLSSEIHTFVGSMKQSQSSNGGSSDICRYCPR